MQESLKVAQSKLKEYWGYSSFRPGQDEVVRSVLEGKDTLVLFPTGGGKSLCYQVPALVFEGLTIVISPLIALMQDQVMQLKDRDIPATFINSSLSRREVEQRLVNARNGMYKLLYCAPERLKTELWQAEMKRLPIELIAIDEAHCISEWGHDFRPSYRDIKSSLEPIADQVKWLALTATATPEVKEDIISSLQMKDPAIITRGFRRPNLKWWVIQSKQKRKELVNAVNRASAKGDGLIYGGTRRNCEQLAALFSSKGIPTEAYHAGIEAGERKNIQQRWISGETPLVAATNAFGMGIDKPDCRYVIHDQMPYSLEAYYQEAGRAGRDGKEAFPILFFESGDLSTAESRLNEQYPTKEELEHAYQMICDSLNLAVGTQMEEMVSFDAKDIVKRGKLTKRKVKACLMVLHQLEVITLIEDVASSVSLQFTLSASGIASFKERSKNEDKKEFIDKLQRLFGNLSYSDPVEIREERVLDHLKINRNQLIKGLNVLSQHDQILIYTLLSERNLIRVNEARSAKLPVDLKNVRSHRDAVFEKLEYMKGYIYTDECREVYLRNYFGDTDAEACGKCDNCTRSARRSGSIKEEWVKKVVDQLSRSKKSVSELGQNLGLDTPDIKNVLRFLKKEGSITVCKDDPSRYQLSAD